MVRQIRQVSVKEYAEWIVFLSRYNTKYYYCDGQGGFGLDNISWCVK